MKSIEINSIPLHEVFEDLARCFKTRLRVDCEEYCIKIPPAWGTGFIKGIAFRGGINLIQYHCTFKMDLEIQFIVNKVHPVKFLYCLDGTLHHRFENSNEVNPLIKYQNAIAASARNTGHILQFNANTKTRICSLEVNRKEFKPELLCYFQKSGERLHFLLKDDTAKQAYYYQGLYSLEISEYFHKIDTLKHPGIVDRLYMEGKAYQILSHQLIQFEDDLQAEENREVLRQAEITAIQKAIRIIEVELENLDSVLTLAKRVGLNQNKLQEGFNHLYSLSVNEYIHQERMKAAVALLKHTRLSMTEIMERIGLTSKSYFSKIFRDTYGVSPSTFRNRTPPL